MIDPASSGAARAWLVRAATLLVLIAIAVRLAWLGDDAYITLRSVENWASGNGLCWNTQDRVQTYTHPLWMFVLTCGRLLSGEVYFTAIALGLLVSGAAVLGMLARAVSVPAIVATGVALAGARAFGDYMTSGLETPLTFVLLVGFVAVVGAKAAPRRRYTRAVLLASLCALNRMDLALLCLPGVLAAMRDVGWRDRVLRGFAGAAPFLAWLVFAAVYYGSPLPVTAHAKAFGLGIPAGELAAQGLRYLAHAATTDPALFAVVALGAPALCLARRTRWLGLGAVLYVAYVVKVGGDFMQGRFLLPPFVVVVASAGAWLAAGGWRRAGPVVAALVVLAGLGGVPAWLRTPSHDTPLDQETIDRQHGIVDERCMYYRELGLFSPTRAIPRFGALEQLAFPEGRERRWWLLNGAVGAAGFGAGANGHVVDPLLCDPLVARLPARDPRHWRIGHVLRRIPEGYWESLRDGANRIHHDGLRRYYEDLRLATQAPVFAGERLAAVVRLLRGANEDGLRAFVAEQYRAPPRLEVAAAQLSDELAAGAYWFDEPRVHVVYEGGVAVPFGEQVAARELRVQVLGLCRFRFRFLAAGQVRGESFGVPEPPVPGLGPLRVAAGLRTERVPVPADVGAFDTLWVDFVEVADSDKATGPPGLASVRR